MDFIYSEEFFQWVLLPLMIFAARVADVSLGTLRIVFISKGRRVLAPLIGFVEIFIWIMVIQQIMQNMDNIYYALVYAAGFSCGTYVGVRMEELLALGRLSVRIITPRDCSAFVRELRSNGYGVTQLPGQGATGPMHIIYTMIERKRIVDLTKRLQRFDPKAFFTVEDVRLAREGIFAGKPGYVWISRMFPRAKKK